MLIFHLLMEWKGWNIVILKKYKKLIDVIGVAIGLAWILFGVDNK